MAQNYDVNIKVNADDNASSKLAKLSANLKTGLTTAVVGAGAAFGGLAVLVKQSIDAADEATKVQAQLEAVLKSTGNAAGLYAEDILDQAKALQKVTTFGDEAITSTANLLLTFTNIKGAVFQEALPAILDMSVALGQDLKGSAIQVGKALNDPINGITALRKVGVAFTDEQQKQIEVLVKSGKTMEAQRMILKELGTEFGGSAQAQAETFGGKMTQLKEQIGDLMEAIGVGFIPLLTKITTFLQPIIDQITTWIELNPELVGKIIAFSGIASGLVVVLGGLGLVLPAIITGFQLLIGPVGLVLLGITGVSVAVAAMITKWQEVSAFLNDNVRPTFDQIKIVVMSVWSAFVDFMKPAIDSLWEAIRFNLWPALQDFWNVIKNQLLPALAEFWEASKPIVTLVGLTLYGAFLVLIKGLTITLNILVRIIAFFTELASVITEVFVIALQKAVDWINKIVDGFKAVIEWGKKAGKWIGGKVSDAVTGGGGGFQSGGLVNAPLGQPVFTTVHGGERITPAGRMVGSGGGSGITVNINGGTYLSEGVALEIANMIADVLKLQIRV